LGKSKNNLLTGCLCALAAETLFGFSYILTKQVTDDTSVFTLLAWRFTIAFVFMTILIAAGLIKIKIRGKKLRPLFLIALFNPLLYFLFEAKGISLTTASESGVLLACIPVSCVIASALILREKPSKGQVAGILTTLAGVTITVLAVGISASFSVAGYSFLLVSVIVYALYSVYVEKAGEFSSAEITYIMMTTGAIVFSVIALAEAASAGTFSVLVTLPFRDSGFLTAVLFQGIGCSVVSFFLSNVAIAKIGVNRTSSFIGVSTVVSILSGVLLLKEPFSLWQIVGAVIILAGVYIANATAPVRE